MEGKLPSGAGGGTIVPQKEEDKAPTVPFGVTCGETTYSNIQKTIYLLPMKYIQ